MNLYAIENVSNVYADAIVSDENSQLLFLSVWGLDTAIQTLLAGLTLPLVKGGYRALQVRHAPDECVYHYVDEPERLLKLTGRSNNNAAHVRGLVQLWLYDPRANVDCLNHRALLFKRQDEAEIVFNQRLWTTVQQLCPVPLLAEWEGLLGVFKGYGWVNHYRGLKVDAYALDFSSDDVEKRLTAAIQSGELTLPGRPH